MSKNKINAKLTYFDISIIDSALLHYKANKLEDIKDKIYDLLREMGECGKYEVDKKIVILEKIGGSINDSLDIDRELNLISEGMNYYLDNFDDLIIKYNEVSLDDK